MDVVMEQWKILCTLNQARRETENVLVLRRLAEAELMLRNVIVTIVKSNHTDPLTL